MNISMGSIVGNLTAEQPDAQVIIKDFKRCLADYRKHAEAWYGGILDAEQQFQVGDEVGTQDKDSKSSADLYATCPANGKLKLVHSFESARFVPIGNTPVRLVPVVDGLIMGKNEAGTSINVTIGPSGIKEVTGLKPNQQYKITFFPNPTPAQIDSLFNSYQGVIGELSGWLTTQWSTDFLPLWQAHSNASMTGRALQQLDSAWKGFLKAIMGLWGDIKSLYNLVAHPRENYEKLKKFFTEEEIKKIYNASKKAIHTALLIASDEHLMWIYVAAIVAWVKMLPPQTCTEVLAELTTEVLMNILIGVVLTGGIGLTVRVATKALKATQNSGKVMALIEDFTSMLMKLSRKNAEAHAETAKPLLLNAEAKLNPARKADVAIAPPKPAVTATAPKKKPPISGAVEADAQVQARGKKKNATRIEQQEKVDNAPAQSKNPADQPAQCSNKTCTNGEPVSMVTGEELLTLTDGELSGLLRLEWTRLYRSSAVEIDNRLGFGWSHSLSHSLQLDNEGVLWTDNENRQTRFPMPTDQRPAIINSLAQSAIYLGDAPDELILNQAGQGDRFYHFRAGRLITISDAYDNRVHISYDMVDRIKRIDNGAGRSLLLRYDDRHIAAVEYQQQRPEYNERGERQDPWQTVQNLVSYRYNERDQLVCSTNAAGESEYYRYNDQHVILERQLAGGASFFWEWEREGKLSRCIRHWASYSQLEASYIWDDKGTVTVHNADGSEQVYVHDENARLISETAPDGAETQKVYNDDGRLIAEKDALGFVTEYQYNDAGRLIAVVPPEDEPTRYNYYDGQLIEVKRGGSRWLYERNRQGDITQQIDPLGNETHYSYDRQGRLLEIHHPDGSRHQLGWNNLGQLLEERLPDGGQRKYRYDALGRQITRQEETGAITHYQWDAANRLAQITLPGGATRAFAYNAYGKVTAERDELGRITRYEYADNLHLVSRRINPDGSQLRYRYDNSRL
ncbi:RHS repeat-associated core domain protein containing protein, partial [Pseudomonas syringae pv. delphinii]